MTKREVLAASTFGRPIAEEERNVLTSYFVETDQWRRIFARDIDIVYGPKGSGKSAIYSLLMAVSRSKWELEKGMAVDLARFS